MQTSRSPLRAAVRTFFAFLSALLLIPSCSPLQTMLVDEPAFRSAKSISVLPFFVNREELDYDCNADSLNRMFARQLFQKLQNSAGAMKLTSFKPKDSADLVLAGQFIKLHRGSGLGDVCVSISGSILKWSGATVMTFHEDCKYSFLGPVHFPSANDPLTAIVALVVLVVWFVVGVILALTLNRDSIMADQVSKICDHISEMIAHHGDQY
jgi:hypothetical protein